jgi:AraC-like DNA-binding protein
MTQVVPRHAQEARISARLMWPFFRTIGSSPSPTTARILARAGIDPDALGRPETRIPHRIAMETLIAWVAESGDEEVGFRAGICAESSDFEALERLARTCSTLREALASIGRYLLVWNEAGEATVLERGPRALWSFRVTDGVPQPRAVNDFIVVGAARFALRCLGARPPLREVHLIHARPASVAPYAVFEAEVRFGMPHNGFVFDAALLDQPLPGANPGMHAAFETYVRDRVEKDEPTLRNRVREKIHARLCIGRATMVSVARSLAMSAPTLRRRLAEESTTFSMLREELRHELAEQHVRDPRKSVDELAALLGFGHTPTFLKAFRRWTGVTPSQYRRRLFGGDELRS